MNKPKRYISCDVHRLIAVLQKHFKFYLIILYEFDLMMYRVLRKITQLYNSTEEFMTLPGDVDRQFARSNVETGCVYADEAHHLRLTPHRTCMRQAR